MATRDLQANIINSLDDEVLEPFLAVELLFDGDEVVRMWTGEGTLDYLGHSWYGTGQILTVESIEETSEISARGASITLTGADDELVALAYNENYQGRKANIYFGTFNNGTSLDLVFSGYMDQMNIEGTPEASVINLTIENKLIDLERPRVARFTSAYQKSIYPGDKGLDFVEGLQDKEIVLGR